MTKKVLTHVDAISLSKLLDLHCHEASKQGEERRCRYDDGWSDQTVADEFGRGFDKEHVRRLRLSYLGELAPTGGTAGVVEYRDPRVSRLIEKYNTLCDLIESMATSLGEAAWRGEAATLRMDATDKDKRA